MSVSRAKYLRVNSSPAERRMWRLLFPFRTDGSHFRKQAPIGPYVVDMACHHAKLVIEVDGDTHGPDAAIHGDARRDAFLRAEGYSVLRFTNAEVLHNPEGVFDAVARALVGRPPSARGRHPLPNPPHKGEGAPTERLAGSAAPALPDTDTSPLVGEVGRGK